MSDGSRDLYPVLGSVVEPADELRPGDPDGERPGGKRAANDGG